MSPIPRFGKVLNHVVTNLCDNSWGWLTPKKQEIMVLQHNSVKWENLYFGMLYKLLNARVGIFSLSHALIP